MVDMHTIEPAAARLHGSMPVACCRSARNRQAPNRPACYEGANPPTVTDANLGRPSAAMPGRRDALIRRRERRGDTPPMRWDDASPALDVTAVANEHMAQAPRAIVRRVPTRA